MKTKNAPLKILLVEDDEDDVLITSEMLGDAGWFKCTLATVATMEEGIEALESREYDVALVDYRLGPDSGFDLVAAINERGIATPVIILTGQGNTSTDHDAIELGASDYLIKGQFNSDMLVRSIRYAHDRACAKTLLQASEARYRLLFESLIDKARDAMLVMDSRNRVCFANPSARELLGDEVAFSPETRQALSRTGIGICELSLQNSGGPLLEVECQVSETLWEGEAARLLAIRDISARKASEEQLRLMQRSIEASQNGIVIVDALAEDFPITYVNSAFSRITGYSLEEAQGRNCRFLQGGGAESA